MASNSGAQGALGLIALVALVVAFMQVMDLVTDEWRRDYSLIWLLVAGCAGVALLDLVRAKRTKPRAVRQDRIKSLVVGFLDYVQDPAREAWGFKDPDWQREAEQWLANNEYDGLPQFRPAVARQLAALAKDHYWETFGPEVNEALKEARQDRDISEL